MKKKSTGFKDVNGKTIHFGDYVAYRFVAPVWGEDEKWIPVKKHGRIGIWKDPFDDDKENIAILDDTGKLLDLVVNRAPEEILVIHEDIAHRKTSKLYTGSLDSR